MHIYLQHLYKDLTFRFTIQDQKKFDYWIWPVLSPTGQKCIITTAGLSVMYSPFFLIAHQYAKIDKRYEADGYSYPYHVALTFSAFVYFILALFLLRSMLRKHYKDNIVAITLIAVGLGTNLFYYVTREAPMSHAYNFSLIILFLFLLIRWQNHSGIGNTILLGLTAGLISLIRPTNIIVLLFIPLYNVTSFSSLKASLENLIRKWPMIILMALCFILIWVPQFLYWHKVAGKFLYFSYGQVGGRFFFNNPQILNILFSFKKGWFIYTPIMLLASAGIFFYLRDKGIFSAGILIYFIINLYLLASWWSWWFGGGFGNRGFIDSYAVMAFPLAAFIKYYSGSLRKRIISRSMIMFLVAYNLFQTSQYIHGSIHFNWMSWEAYKENFLRLRPTCRFWNILNQPDYEKTRRGIYEVRQQDAYICNTKVTRNDLFEVLLKRLENDTVRLDSLRSEAKKADLTLDRAAINYINNKIDSGLAMEIYRNLKIQNLMRVMSECDTWRKQIEKKARRRNVTFADMALLEANVIFEKYSQKYID